MANTKITGLTQQSVFAFDDLIEGVDVSDTTMAASGTNKKIDLSRFGGFLNPGVCQGRLTLESGVPVSTTDQTAKTNVYFTPYLGNRIAIYDGTRWKEYSFSELTLALGTLTSGLPYDVFIYDNAGTLTLESLAWSNGTTRATALTTQDGIYVKNGATTRRYLGTFYTTSTTTTEDSQGGTSSQTGGKRFLWNMYNQVERHLAVIDTTNSWTYATASYRQANAASGNKVEFICGLACNLRAQVGAFSDSSAASIIVYPGVGIDSTTVNSSQINFGGTPSASVGGFGVSQYVGPVVVGYHAINWLEKGSATGTQNWYGDAGLTGFQMGLSASVLC